MAAMPHPVSAGVLAVVLAAQTMQTACPKDNPTTPQAGELFTTRDAVRFRVETVLTGLEIPWSMNFAPDGRLFITERPGRGRIATLGGSSDLALTLDGVYAQGEAGLLGLALDPEFAQNRFVYLYYSATVPGGAVNRIVRYREVNSRLGERVVLLDNIPAAQIHDGGRLRFGPDGLLYASAGDAADANLAQDVASLAGKILRLNRDGTTPRDNRFSSPVYTYGHRNPQGFDWHPTSGDLWESEHGNNGNDEVNAVRLGLNFGRQRCQGWRRRSLSTTRRSRRRGHRFIEDSACRNSPTTSSSQRCAARIFFAGPLTRRRDASPRRSGCSKTPTAVFATSSLVRMAICISARTIAMGEGPRCLATIG